MPSIIISAHGGRWNTQTQNCPVPSGTNLVFYVGDGMVLPNDAGWEILGQLQAGNIYATPSYQILYAGSNTYDYACWYASEFASGCGIYLVGGGSTPIASLRQYTPDNPLLLSQIMATYSGYDVYWLACREVSVNYTQSQDAPLVLSTSSNAFLKQPPVLDVTSVNEIPGSSVLGYGFNALGDYSVTSVTQQIFTHQNMSASQYTYIPTGITYNVPDNTSVIPNTTTTGTAQVFNTRQQFQNYYSAKAGIKGSYGVFNAQFNAAYSQTFNTDVSYYYGLYETDIAGWNLVLQNQSSNWLSPGFVNDPDVQALPTTYTTENQEKFFAVFRKFGTHFVSQAVVGGSLNYYSAVEESYTSNEATVEANIQLEYNAVFESASAQSQADWNQLGQTWSNSRIVKIDAVGGDNSILNALIPTYDSCFESTFAAWTTSVMQNPAVMDFSLQPLNMIFSGDQATAVAQALQVYLNGAIVATANADYTPGVGQGGGNYTTSSSIAVNSKLIVATPPVTPPAPYTNQYGWVYPVGGYQLALLDRITFAPILTYTYYQDYSGGLETEKNIYAEMMEDIAEVTQTDYICVVAGFAVDLMNYPSTDFAQWLSSCGAAMTGWKKYLGFTGSPGQASYLLIGEKGLLPGRGFESFSASTNWMASPGTSVDVSGTVLLYANAVLQFNGSHTYGVMANWKSELATATVTGAD